MSLQSLADQHFNGRRLMALTASAQLVDTWRDNVEPSNILRSWARAIPQATEQVAELQMRAARDGQHYMDAALIDAGSSPAGPSLNPEGFAGFTYPLNNTPARPLELALEFPAIHALDGLRQGASQDRAMAIGVDSLVKTSTTAIADAGRNADGVAMATEPQVGGYVRQAEPTACSRCVILAGRRYRKNDGFLRHPNCLCEHVPIIRGGESPQIQDSYAMFNALSEADQDRIFTKDGAQAIRDGADIYQVVNARRGMSTTEGGSLVTSSGAGYRRGRPIGWAQRQMDRHGVTGPRMMPEEIYKRASHIPAGEHRDRLIQGQLERHGYLVPDSRGGTEGEGPDPIHLRSADGGLNPQLSGWYGSSGSERRAAIRQGR